MSLIPIFFTLSNTSSTISLGRNHPSNAKPNVTLPFPKGALVASSASVSMTHGSRRYMFMAKGDQDSRRMVGQ